MMDDSLATDDNKSAMHVKVLNKEKVFAHGFLSIEKANVEISTFSGEKMEITRYGLLRPLVVTTLVYLKPSNEVVMVEQFRYSALRSCSGWVTEVVAGVVEEGEPVEKAARREAMEETGYGEEGELHFLGEYYPSVGLSDQLIQGYLLVTNKGSRKGKGGGLAHEGEDIRVHHFPLTKALKLLHSGAFVDSKTIIALSALKMFLQK